MTCTVRDIQAEPTLAQSVSDLVAEGGYPLASDDALTDDPTEVGRASQKVRRRGATPAGRRQAAGSAISLDVRTGPAYFGRFWWVSVDR